MAKQVAPDTNYIISLTNGNKEKNDKPLKLPSKEPIWEPHYKSRCERPITFCTDRPFGTRMAGVANFRRRHEDGATAVRSRRLNAGRLAAPAPLLRTGS